MRTGLLVILTSLLIASTASAAVWDFATEFSGANGNPNGAWSYGWSPIDWSGFTLYVNHSATSWWGWGSDWTPGIWRNTGSSTSYGVPAGGVSLHPGNGTQPSIARWTAPTGANGTAAIRGSFLPGDAGRMLVAVRKNGEFIWQLADSGTFDLTVPIVAGDTIDFAVYGGYGYGNTPLSATITAEVPEPSTAAVLVFGVIPVLGAMVRRRRGV